jgi:hypothetical protein
MTIYFGAIASIISGVTDRQWILKPTDAKGGADRTNDFFYMSSPIGKY